MFVVEITVNNDSYYTVIRVLSEPSIYGNLV